MQKIIATLIALLLGAQAHASDEAFSLPGEPTTTRPATEAGLVEYFTTRFHAHEPMYFVAGSAPTAKFQLSMKYELIDLHGFPNKPDGESGVFISYSQTSFWDLAGDSEPFVDNSYRPGLMFQYAQNAPQWVSHVARFGLQGGVEHESNGQDGLDSRSLNIAYVRPAFTFGDNGAKSDFDPGRRFFVTVAPRVYAYIFSLDDNNDSIARYRGYGDLRLIAGWRGGLQFAATARVGSEFDKGSLQLDVTHPIKQLGNVSIDAQFFTGYGERLDEFDQSTTTFRLGLALIR